jgi:hypothetical protein
MPRPSADTLPLSTHARPPPLALLRRRTLEPRTPVLGRQVVSSVTDTDAAARRPEFAVLSALAHGAGEQGAAIAAAVPPALRDLDEERGAAGRADSRHYAQVAIMMSLFLLLNVDISSALLPER